jgi:hypothetical protein
MTRVLSLTVAAVFCLAVEARAQSEAVIGLGLAVSSVDPVGSLALGTGSIGPLLRLKLGPGLGPVIGMNWYTAGVQAIAEGQLVYLGRLRIRPVMVGVGYNWNRGRVWLVPSIVGGYSFNRLYPNSRARLPFRESLGSTDVSFDAGNALAWRSQVAFWYDVAPRVGLLASIAYIRARPTLTVSGDHGVYRASLDASATVVTFGLVYGVF